MKNLLIITALVLGVITNAFSQHGNHRNNDYRNYQQHQVNKFSKITLQSQNGGDFRAIVNGTLYFSNNGSVNINSIAPGYQDITIVREQYRKNGTLTVSGTTKIYISAQSQLYASIYNGTSISVNQIVALQTRYDFHQNKRQCYSPVAMQDYEFQRLNNNILCQRFELDRMNILKSAVATNYFTTSQVAVLSKTLMSEMSKLDFLKIAFSKTIDKEYYNIVFNELSYSNSRRELSRYTGIYYSENPVCYQRY